MASPSRGVRLVNSKPGRDAGVRPTAELGNSMRDDSFLIFGGEVALAVVIGMARCQEQLHLEWDR